MFINVVTKVKKMLLGFLHLLPVLLGLCAAPDDDLHLLHQDNQDHPQGNRGIRAGSTERNRNSYWAAKKGLVQRTLGCVNHETTDMNSLIFI